MNLPKNWVLYRSVCYLNGQGLTFGLPILPEASRNSECYSVGVDLVKSGVAVVDKTFNIFKDSSLDHVFIGRRLETVDNPRLTLKEGISKLKVNGHLLINVGIAQSNPGTTEFYPYIIRDMVSKFGRWEIKEEIEIENQYLLILKRLPGHMGIIPKTPRSSKPRVCIARYGAYGDAIILTPLLRYFHEHNWHVTLNATRYCLPIFENNPNIDNIISQEKDSIPNNELNEYWNYWKVEYDKYVNLSESLEGSLLKVEGRREFFTSKAYRHETCNKNYYDATFAKAEVPGEIGHNGELFFTKSEERKAKEFFDSLVGKFKILWALNGSSHHKVYPLMEPCLEEWFKKHDDSIAITVGDEIARLLEFEHPQLIPKAGQWKIRESLIATKYANLVIGPETVITNSSGCFDTPKITLLSHSSHENLCKYWENDYCLEPDTHIAACYPCHQLHYTASSCPEGVMEDMTTGKDIGHGPICAMGAITGQRLLARVDEVYQKWASISN